MSYFNPYSPSTSQFPQPTPGYPQPNPGYTHPIPGFHPQPIEQRVYALEQLVSQLQGKITYLEIQLGAGRQYPQRLQCTVCNGKGAFDKWGGTCTTADMHFKEKCTVCHGTTFV